MKLCITFALIAFLVYASADHHDYVYYMTQPDLLVGTWYFDGTEDHDPNPNHDGCCIPTGTIAITNNALNQSEYSMTSNQWSGSACSTMGITSNSIMGLPYPDSSTYRDVFSTSWPTNSQYLSFNINGLTVGNFTPANSSDYITLQVGIDFLYVPDLVDHNICYVTLSKAQAGLKTDELMM